MTNVTVIGTQWGDEGKGKIVDWLSQRADVVVRFQGGHNAGHTLVIDDVTYKLSLLPSGIVRKNKLSMIGNGVVVDIFALLKEIENVASLGVDVSPKNLIISKRAHMILPVHQQIDMAREAMRGNDKIGTTGRGIGTAYEDKVARRGIHLGDLLHDDELKTKLNNLCDHHNIYLQHFNQPLVNSEKIYTELCAVRDDIIPFLDDVGTILHTHYQENDKILFEGAQGVLLDVDHGTYPFVTSSNTITAQASIGSGVGAKATGYALGIVKAYTTRVGEGPFVSELHDDIGQKIGERGHEFGTVTGRKRRCGWFDALLVRHSCRVAGIDGLALTKLDVLDGFDELKICVGYDVGGKKYDEFPSSLTDLRNATPVYETLPGWHENTFGVQKLDDLPNNAINYIKRVESLINTKVSLLSTSPKREDTILIYDPFA